MRNYVEELSKKASTAATALEAMQYSQAANNVANSLASLCANGQAPVEFDVKKLVDRFLQWKLPEDFMPDGGIMFDSVGHTPIGTNLFTATQADAMVRHMLDGLL